MERISDDLLLEFLVRTPTKSVLRAAAVSKPWRYLINQDRFRNMHADRCPSNDHSTPLFLTAHRTHDHSVITMSLAGDLNTRSIWKQQCFDSWKTWNWVENEYDLANSCNGLVCIMPNDYGKHIEVCNPLMLHYTSIPPPLAGDVRCLSVGLGFSQLTKEYKVIAIVEDFNFNHHNPAGGDPIKIMMHKLGSSEPWTLIATSHVTALGRPIYIQGVMYWVTSYTPFMNYFHILCFDVETEIFTLLDEVPVRNWICWTCELFEFRGKLSTVLCSESETELCFEIWVLEDRKMGFWNLRHWIELPRSALVAISRLIGMWERDDGVLQLRMQDVMLEFDERKDPKEWYTVHRAPCIPDTWRLCANYKPSMVALEGIGCRTERVILHPN